MCVEYSASMVEGSRLSNLLLTVVIVFDFEDKLCTYVSKGSTRTM